MTSDHGRPGGKPSRADVFESHELLTWSGLATLLEWLPPLLDAQLQRDAGLTHFEFGLLYALSVAPDQTLRLSVLAGFANSTLTRLSRAVTRLERRQWVRRSTDPTDGRYTLATLTDLGRETVEQAMPGHVATVRQLVLAPLTARQQSQLRGIAQRLVKAAGAGAWQPPEGAVAATATSRSGPSGSAPSKQVPGSEPAIDTAAAQSRTPGQVGSEASPR